MHHKCTSKVVATSVLRAVDQDDVLKSRTCVPVNDVRGFPSRFIAKQFEAIPRSLLHFRNKVYIFDKHSRSIALTADKAG